MKSNAWQEPESAFNEDAQSKYPYNQMFQSESGHTVEFDDTPGRERVRVQHRKETFVEMHPNGDLVIKSEGNQYEITVKDRNILVKGQCNITVLGDAVIDIQGDKTERIKGNFKQVVEGNYEQLVKKEARIISEGDMYLTANPGLGGTMSVSTGAMVVYSDVNIDGELTAKKITSQTRVDAGLGVSAGVEGFVSVTGGLSVGLPVAIPACIMAAGFINSETVVAAPLGTFGTMTAGLMTDFINTKIYNTHTHPSYRGPTGTPVAPMV